MAACYARKEAKSAKCLNEELPQTVWTPSGV